MQATILRLRYIYISTFLFWMATNLFAPFLAIFALTNIPNTTVTDIGIASMIFFLSFAISVIFLSTLTDRIHGLKDDFMIIFIGFISRGIVLMLFVFANNIGFFFILHFLLGITRGFTDVSQDKIIAKLSSEDLLSTSFGIRIGLVNFAAAIGAGLGGFFIDLIGYNLVIPFVGILTIIAGIIFYKGKRELNI